MSFDKNKTIAEVGRRARLRNHDVQKMLEALIEVWSEELARGGRIELENFLVLEVKRVDRGELNRNTAYWWKAASRSALHQEVGGKAEQDFEKAP